jgi:protein TonB
MFLGSTNVLLPHFVTRAENWLISRKVIFTSHLWGAAQPPERTMAPLTKDSVEVASPATTMPATQAGTQDKPTSVFRSDALSLEVAVKVHGSRVINVARGIAPQTEPFEEQTVTMIVFPQGAVLRMSTTVNVSQMLVLTNLKTKQDSICRVLKVRPNANQGSYVEVEFTHRQPGYWGIQFPSEGPVAANTIAPPQTNLESQTIAPVSVTPVTRPAATTVPREPKPASVAPPAPFVPSLKPESSFISIGSQEKVQDAASATAITKPLSPVEERFESPALSVAKNVSAIDPLPAPPPAPTSLPMDELLGDADSASLSEASVSAEEESASADASSSPEAMASLDSATSDVSQSAASEAFGARLDSTFGSSAAKSVDANPNWILIAACVAVLVAGLGAGIAYFRQLPANASAQTAPIARNVASETQPAASNSTELPAITPTGQPYMAGGSETNPPARSNVGSAPPVAPPSSATNVTKAPAPSANHSPAPSKQSASGVTSNMMSTALTARPTTSTRGNEGQADQAPILDPAATAGNSSLPGISGPNAASLPMPTIQPAGPSKIGGDVKDPRLISSVAPVYPVSARSTGIQGDVVVETTIDKSGNVVRMHVVSGPLALRSCALESLRRWKYEPSKLNGEPVEVQMLVTIKFRL